ncbi:MAG TPA: hypothetical protein VMB48_09275 [Steroidobacteraceae bacterium]|nr:hypothetical protein [Steroidobacteraceae bacterium]
MAWDRDVPGCFGAVDLIFCAHPVDEERAFEWLADLRRRKVSWKAARAQLQEFLGSRTRSAAHIRRQLSRARTMLKPWLRD